ncbi:MAG: hypothetical protein GX100_06995 [candidate division WS1 bacterium]|jgi:formate-dependent nitrite reductase membrane component NrfD|nr:hypothetical protein [candidate division WS1 bacterium]
MRSTLWGMLVGLALFFPGTVLVQWLVTRLGLYQAVTLTDSCLVMIMVLLTIAIFQQRALLRRPASGREESGEVRKAAGHRTSRYESDLRTRR